MNQETKTLVFRTNKLWSALELAFGLFFITYALFIFKNFSPKIVFIVWGIYILLEAFITWKAAVTLTGTVLTSRYWRTKSVDLSQLLSVQAGRIGGSFGDGVKFTDKADSQLVFIPKLFIKSEMVSLFGHIQQYFPQPVTSLSWVVKMRLKQYGLK